MTRPTDQPNQAQPRVQVPSGGIGKQQNQAHPRVQAPSNNGGIGNQQNQAHPRVQVPSNNGGNGNQPNIQTRVPVNNNQAQNLWSSELFDCLNDGENAVITCLAPCVTFGQIAEIVDEGATPCATSGLLYGLLLFIGVPCIYSFLFRTKMRNKFGLPDAPAPDLFTHLCCEYCALCQEYRELKHRGFDPIIGWDGNMQVQAQQEEMMAPPTSQRMRG